MTRKLLVAVIAGLALAAVAVGAMSASAGTSSAGESAGNQLAGTWQSVVNLPAPAPALRSMQVYTADGSWVETSNQPPASRSQMFGAWERVDGRHYAATGQHFLFDPVSGAFTGWRKISRTFELSQDGQSFSGVAHVTTYNAAGGVTETFVAQAAAQRMQVERAPAQP
jgi:hypothetical protein